MSSSVINLAQRSFLDSLRESNLRAILSISHHKYPVLVVSIGIQLRASITEDPAIHRLVLPYRGAPTYPPHSLNSGRTHFLGHARPRPNDTPQPYLQLSRGVPAGLHPKRKRVL